MNNPQKEMYEASLFLFNELIKQLKYCYIRDGIVRSVEGNKAIVEIDHAESVCGIASGLPLYVDDVVKVIVNGKYSDKNVLYKVMRVDEKAPPTDGDMLDAIEKKHFPHTVDGYEYITSVTQPSGKKKYTRWLDISTDKPMLKINVGTEGNPNYVGIDAGCLQGKEPSDFMNVLTGSSLPVASTTHRGKFFQLFGGSNVEDKLYLCIKKGDNNYVWKLVNLTDQ